MEGSDKKPEGEPRPPHQLTEDPGGPARFEAGEAMKLVEEKRKNTPEETAQQIANVEKKIERELPDIKSSERMELRGEDAIKFREQINPKNKKPWWKIWKK